MYRPVKTVLCMYATVIHMHGLLKTAEFSAEEFITLTKGFGKLWTYPDLECFMFSLLVSHGFVK